VPERGSGSVPERGSGSVPERGSGSVPERGSGSVPERISGRGPGAESSVAKLFGSNHLALNGDLAMAIEGADAMLHRTDAYEDGFWQQLFLDQWYSRIGGGTEQIQRNILGERILGLPAEPRPDKGAPFREIPRNS